MLYLKCPLLPLLICVVAVVLKLRSKVRFCTGDLTKKVQKATQQIDLFSCIIALIDLQISRLGLEKAADSSIESEDKENTI